MFKATLESAHLHTLLGSVVLEASEGLVFRVWLRVSWGLGWLWQLHHRTAGVRRAPRLCGNILPAPAHI